MPQVFVSEEKYPPGTIIDFYNVASNYHGFTRSERALIVGYSTYNIYEMSEEERQYYPPPILGQAAVDGGEIKTVELTNLDDPEGKRALPCPIYLIDVVAKNPDLNKPSR